MGAGGVVAHQAQHDHPLLFERWLTEVVGFVGEGEDGGVERLHHPDFVEDGFEIAAKEIHGDR